MANKWLRKATEAHRKMYCCGSWAGAITGPYFFKYDAGHNVAVIYARYKAMIFNFLLPKMQEMDIVKMWFQQDARHLPQSTRTYRLK